MLGRHRWVLLAGAAAVALVSGLTIPSATSSDVPAGTVGHAGRWMTDGSGRVVIVHGVNVSSKSLPAYPGALGFGDDDAAFLASEGFNAVRLTVERYAVEPSPGHFDDTYLANVAATVETLARHGIFSLIDFHQDEFGPVFHDNGYPAWMTMTDGLPNAYQVGFPFQYLANPALERAFDHLWADSVGPDGRPLQLDDAAILAHAAAVFSGLPDVLGYEILNEPWPGSAYPTCVGLEVGCPLFDQGPLSAYYARMDAALRGADPAHLVWYEPLVLFNYGIPTHVVAPKDSRLGFAFHDYGLCSATPAYAPLAPACGAEDSMVLSNAVAYSGSTGDALLETEFGATTDTAQIGEQVAAYDKAMVPWMFWSYAELDNTGSGGTFGPPTQANVNTAVLRSLARPYPQLVSGTPSGWSFDTATKVFTFSYTTLRADGGGSFPPGAVSDVFLPAVQYPSGYTVRVDGGRVVSGDGASLLQIASTVGATTVSVQVSPKS